MDRMQAGTKCRREQVVLLSIRYASIPGMEEIFKGTCQSI
jgi:hypothetical protein